MPSDNSIPASSKTIVQDSKYLSKILRHTALSYSLPIAPDGYISVSDILSLPRFKNYTVASIRSIVHNCPKRRFSIISTTTTAVDNDDDDNEDGKDLLIRANYGHSIEFIDTRLMWDLIEDSQALLIVHGTNRETWEKNILKEGALRSMRRNCVHFAAIEECDGDVRVGPRNGSDVWIYVWTGRGSEFGVRFYKVGNGVVLSPGVVGKECWEFVVDKRTGKVIWERNDQKERERRTVRTMQGLLHTPKPVRL